MKTLILFLLFSGLSFGQQYKFAWITDTHIGFNSADSILENIVDQINNLPDIKFIIHSGDVTEKGLDEEFEKAKNILDKLNKPYFIIQGNHDSKWSESGGTKFTELWDDANFSFQENNDVFIGLNSAILWRGGGGHVNPESLEWLNNIIEPVDTSKNYIVITHHPLNSEIDNWFNVTNKFDGIFNFVNLSGHTHVNSISDFNEYRIVSSRSAIKFKTNTTGFNVVEVNDSSMIFTEYNDSLSVESWLSLPKSNKNKITRVDSSITNYDVDIISEIDLNSTIICEPLIVDDKIITASYSGLISCYSIEGKLLWDFDVFGNVTGKPTAIDGYLIVGTLQGDLITLNLYTGEQIQSMGFDETITSGLLSFEYNGNRNLMFPKQTDSKAAVIFGTSKGKIYCYDVETLQEYWVNNDPKGMIEIKPLQAGNNIYFGAWDTFFYSLDIREGWLIWKWRDNKSFYYSPASVTPVTDGKSIYFTAPNNKVYSLDSQLGKLNWQNDKLDVWESIGISNNSKYLYIKGRDSKFYRLPSKNGKGGLTYKPKFGLDTTPTTPLEFDGNIYFTTKNGTVIRIKGMKYKSILNTGPARLHNIQQIADNRFLISNMDGEIIIFDYFEKD